MTTITPSPQRISLYDLTDGLIAAIEKMDIIADDDSLTEEQKTALTQQALGEIADGGALIGETMNGIAGYIRSEEHRIEAERKESARLAARARARENRISSMKEFVLLPCLGRLGGKFKSALWSIYLQKSQSVEITDDKALPDEYWRVKKEPDKALIKGRLKEGAEVPGAELIEKESVVLR